MERVSAEVAGAVTVAWLNLQASKNVTVPDESIVATFYKTIYETIEDCSATRHTKSRITSKPDGY